jgi:hypothetical protein
LRRATELTAPVAVASFIPAMIGTQRDGPRTIFRPVHIPVLGALDHPGGMMTR